MRFGLGPLRLDRFDRSSLSEMAEAAEAAGFDSVWVAEERAAGAGGGAAAAAFVAQRTILRVGALIELDLYHPLYLAEDLAVADLGSGGRLEVLLAPAPPAAVSRYGVRVSAARRLEALTVLADAMAGRHLQFQGRFLRIPGGLAENQPAPAALAVNPRPAQVRVPTWLLMQSRSDRSLTRRLGFGGAVFYSDHDAVTKTPSAALPDLVLCPGDVKVDSLRAAADDGAGYFLLAASSPGEALSAGRLFPSLRMPELPEWVTALGTSASLPL